ncbi:MAG: PSD1 and planctomycete cytochrome C domain-containing protein [Phycisphaeraceae bacterium]
MYRLFFRWLCLGLCLACIAAGCAQQGGDGSPVLAGVQTVSDDATQADPGEPVDFAREVLPILSDKCFACHGPDTREKDLVRLDSFEAATRDLGGYKAIDPADLGESEIIYRLHDELDPMPPADADKQLTDAERDLIVRWIKQGGGYAQHWAFVPPSKTLPRHLEGAAAIDYAIGKRLKRAGIGFAPQADKATLARRAALVLTGLPPERDKLEAFLNDDTPGAYERFVDQLFESPRYGEHQARFWLDAVRYGDTHGLHLDNRRGIHPYRDWVVRAFNNNLPLDDFITWQLAGDLLENPTLEQLVATGYVRMNPTTAEGGVIPAEFQAKNSFDRVATFGTVMLGLTVDCAQCHTHKYDPITHTEYYELYAFFNNTAESPLDGNKFDYQPVIKAPADQTAWTRWAALEAQAMMLLSAVEQTRNGQPIPGGNLMPRVKAIAESDDARYEAYKPEAQDLYKRMDEAHKAFTTTLVAKELPEPRVTKLLERGEYNLPTGEPLSPSTLAVLGELPEGAPANRLGLAQWLTARGHPLASRVLINRVWQRVFGDGLVRTPEDFGLQGEHPTHPELLDYLAVELQDSGWDLRHMLRLMVTSKTFKQSSAHRAQVEDPENRLFARGPGHRLDAEEIRDVALWASGLLRDEMGGAGVKPYQPPNMWKQLAHPASNTKQYKQDTGDKLYRRSLYVYWKRTSPHPMMTLFDAPSRESSCVRRSRTNTSLQSLGLLNETQRIEAARMLAERLLAARDDDGARLDHLFQLLASRKASAVERDACLALLERMKRRYSDHQDDAEALLSVGEAPRDASLDLAEHAAWTQVAATVLASDVAIRLY